MSQKVNAIRTTDTSDLVSNTSEKKTDYNTKTNETKIKITDHDHDEYITTQVFNKLTAESFAARLKQANLATKSDIDDLVEKIN